MCTSVNIQYYSLTAARTAALRCVLSGAHWLGAFPSLVKPSAKTNSVGVERHFIYDAWTMHLVQTNMILLRTTRAKVCYDNRISVSALLLPLSAELFQDDTEGIIFSKIVKHDYSPSTDGMTRCCSPFK